MVQASKGGKACLGSVEPRDPETESPRLGALGTLGTLASFVSEGLKSLKRCKIRPQRT